MNARKALERSAKSEHGDKLERWPTAIEERSRAAEEAIALSVPFAVKAAPKPHARAETHYDALTQTGRTN